MHPSSEDAEEKRAVMARCALVIGLVCVLLGSGLLWVGLGSRPQQPTPPHPAPYPPPLAPPSRPLYMPPSSPQAVVELLNTRFVHGHPSNDLSAVGVFVHQFDTPDKHPSPWRPCPPNTWCEKWADRFSASVINQRAPHVYDAIGSGFVLSPDAIEVLCSWAQDGGSMGRRCAAQRSSGATGRTKDDTKVTACIPGCSEGSRMHEATEEPFWCNSTRRAEAVANLTLHPHFNYQPNWCPWEPGQMQDMLERHDAFIASYNASLVHCGQPSCLCSRCFKPLTFSEYPLVPDHFCTSRGAVHRHGFGSHRYNEVVLGAGAWVRNLPRTIMALFFMARAGGTEHEARARGVHTAFVREYGEVVPLLRLNLTSGTPFEETTLSLSAN